MLHLSQWQSQLRHFMQDEEGAQIIEYALIIAVISLALIVGLKALTDSGGGFSTWMTKVSTCLSTPASCVQ